VKGDVALLGENNSASFESFPLMIGLSLDELLPWWLGVGVGVLIISGKSSGGLLDFLSEENGLDIAVF
jgi:hypothetical protein